MRTYKHLTQGQRYQICALLKENISRSQIARNIGVHKSTIAREVSRNTVTRKYYALQAQRMAMHRRGGKAIKRITPQTWAFVEEKIRQQWSPQQIAGRLKALGMPAVSHESIYKYVAYDRMHNGTLCRHLRHGKKRRKRYGSCRRAGPVANRVSIEKRPAVVETRTRTGDWEADTVIGKGPHALVTIVERRSRMTCIAKVARKGAEEVREAMVQALQPHARKVLTITSDNGAEFARHEKIAFTLKASFFFSHPYCAWERGLNENTNGLIRQYFPKSNSFQEVTNEQIKDVIDKLNNRPRKALGFKTPLEVFSQELDVALQG